MNKDIIKQWKIFTIYLNLISNSHISNLILLCVSNMIIDNWIRKGKLDFDFRLIPIDFSHIKKLKQLLKYLKKNN